MPLAPFRLQRSEGGAEQSNCLIRRLLVRQIAGRVVGGWAALRRVERRALSAGAAPGTEAWAGPTRIRRPSCGLVATAVFAVAATTTTTAVEKDIHGASGRERRVALALKDCPSAHLYDAPFVYFKRARALLQLVAS